MNAGGCNNLVYSQLFRQPTIFREKRIQPLGNVVVSYIMHLPKFCLAYGGLVKSKLRGSAIAAATYRLFLSFLNKEAHFEVA